MGEFEITLDFNKKAKFPSVKAVSFYRDLLKFGEIFLTSPDIFTGENDVDKFNKFKYYLKSEKDISNIENYLKNILKTEPDFSDIKINIYNKKTKIDSTNISYNIKNSILKIEEWKINKMNNYIGELIIAKSNILNLIYDLKFANDIDKIKELYKEFHTAFQNIDDIIYQINELNLSIKMVNFESLFNKIIRITRDLSKDKKIKLILSGTDTQIEKNIIDELNDPFLHLIRNAVDHGIESPEERIKKGKKAEGIIKINAYNEADSVLIEISDNGRGIDIEKIKKKIVSKGIYSADEVEKLSESEIIDFIFKPGFSTSDKITDISGRGVGMDVVKNSIDKLDGIIDVKTRINKGTTFIIRIPLSLSIIEVIMIKMLNKVVCIPVTSVLATLRYNNKIIKRIGNKKVIMYKEEIIPLIEIDKILNPNHTTEKIKYNYVIITGSVEKRLGILVEDIINKEEVMIKSLNKYLGRIKGLKGATILGNGDVALILNIKDIISKFMTENNSNRGG